jgi:sphingosine kinase
MSWNLNGTDSPSLAALAIVKGLRMPLDLISITQGNRRTLSFLSQSVGIIAECDLGTENMRWLGATRFTVGYIMRLLGKTVWPCDVAIGVESDNKEAMKREYQQQVSSNSVSKEDTNLGSSSSETEEDEPSLPSLKFGTINDPLPAGWNIAPYLNLGNFYAGNMTHMSGDASVFTVALPNDGLLDLMCIDGDIPILRAMQLAGEGGKGNLLDQPEVKYRKVVGYRIIPHKKEGYISIDGERVPFEGFQAEVHKGLGCVLSKNGRIYEPRGSTS